MTKHDLVKRLLKIRDFELRSEISDLKSRVAALDDVERQRSEARSAAAEAIDSGAALTDLGALGEARLANRRLAGAIQLQVDAASKKVERARQLHDSVSDMHNELRAAKLARQEYVSDLEAESFFGWRTSLEPRR
ncbi:MAG TPA: hypothetical protein VMB26_01555 [Candidatus Binataceae bacterium]|nr:hypothetical protein [Candidatus Binataceae bacterium]